MMKFHLLRRVMNFVPSTSVITLCLFLLQWGTSRCVAQNAYTTRDVHDGGRISGRVVLGTASFNPTLMPVVQDNRSCGKEKRSPRLVIGKDGGVADAIVYLDGISAGKSFSGLKDYLLTQQNCEYSPHTLVVPVGTKLNIVNNDAILHNAHCYECAKNSRTIFNIAQPIKGLKSCTRALETPGLLSLSCDAGHPWMSAYVMVAQHPYYAVTDKNGNFSLADVPPGQYTLHFWHEGVSIVNKELEHDKVKKYEYEEPYEQTQEVKVSPNSTTTTKFTLVLR